MQELLHELASEGGIGAMSRARGEDSALDGEPYEGEVADEVEELVARRLIGIFEVAVVEDT